LTADKLAVLRGCGVNRMSIGAQSIFDHHLRTLGRVHRAFDVERAVALCRDAGIARVSLDFIFGVPGQTMREWNETLARAISWNIDHLSCYALTFEPGTEFFARRQGGRITATPEELELAMFRFTERKLRVAGLDRYEISNYARPGLECQHNINYWRNGSYVGFGAGAHSFVGGVRRANERHLGRYVDAVRERGDAAVSSESLSGLDAARETLVFGLRMSEGVDLARIGERFGVDLMREVGKEIDRLVAGRFVALEEGRLRLARRGWRVADEIAATFLA
jgi:oxygen-independent coproporphyrinogen-3 oxidase